MKQFDEKIQNASGQNLYAFNASGEIRKSAINESCMLFFITKTYSPLLTPTQLYDATRQFWYRVAEDNRTRMPNGNLKYPIALSIYDSVVVSVYSILVWFEAGATFSTREMPIEERVDRYEFIGNIIPNHPLLGQKIIDDNGSGIRANQQGYGYIN